MTRTARLLHGHVLDKLAELPDGSVHLSVSSPPYFQLRSYLAANDPLKRFEIGQEATPEEHVARLVEVYGAQRRVLRDDGTLWIVVGDKHVDDRKWGGATGGKATAGLRGTEQGVSRARVSTGLREGNLAGIPYRLALALQADGWYWRSIIAWEKLSCMPGSQFGWHWAPHRVKVAASKRAAPGSKHHDAHWKPQGSRNGRTFEGRAEWAPCPGCAICLPNDGLVLRKGKWRPTTSHETILMFSKSETYYGDGEAVREPDKGTDHPRRVLTLADRSGGLLGVNTGIRTAEGRNGAGRNLRSVWRDASPTEQAGLLAFLAERFGEEEVAGAVLDYAQGENGFRDVLTLGPEPLAGAHFAAFPSAIPSLIIRCATSEAGCCASCGAPWARVLRRERGSDWYPPKHGGNGHQSAATKGDGRSETLGWRPTCVCGAGAVPCTVLDPFVGSGRTGVAALELGRSFIGIDLSETYLDTIARPAIKAALAQEPLRFEAPEPEPISEQAHLFAEEPAP